MRNFLLFVFFSLISFISYGQLSNNCPPGTTDPLTFINLGSEQTEICNLTSPLFTDDGLYTHTISGPIINGYYAFSVSVADFYKISVIATGGSPASGDLSAGFTGNPSECPINELVVGNITTGFDITDCVSLSPGNTYIIATALNAVSGGEFTISITRGGIGVCESAETVIEGPNLLNNSFCGGGRVWSKYVVTNELPQNEHISVNVSVTNGTLNPANLFTIYLNGCASNGGTLVTSPVTCLSPGDVIYIETGHNTLTGNYTLTIDQFYDGEPNDDCADLAGAIPAITCDSGFTGNGDPEACPDPLSNIYGCAAADAVGVWYRFRVHSSVPSFSFTTNNGEYQVWTGPNCGALSFLGCDDDPALQNITGDPNITYWVLVFEDGSFTAESDVDVPGNDRCADAVELTNGIQGYNACATDSWNYCLPDDPSHTVHYEYTNSTGSYVDLEITINGIDLPDVAAAGEVSVAVIEEDCVGNQFQGFIPVCKTLGTPFSVSCIPPGESFILIVGSADGQEGGFVINFTQTPNPVANDLCSGADDLGPIATDCLEENNNNLTNVGACQDDFNHGGCNFNQTGFHGVWYQFTTDARAELADIQTDLPNAIFALYTGNCNSLSYVAGSCSGTGSIDDVNVNPNTTYYLLISSATESANFNIGITIKNIPDNDLCNDAETLTNGIEGTTSCATAQLSYCGLNGTSHDVFYTYTNNTGSNIDLEVTVSPSTATTGTAATNIGVLMLSACPNTLFPGTDEECNTLGTQFTVACIENGETVIFVIGSPDGAQGDFTIDFNVVSDSPDNDECIDATPLIYDACVWETFNGTNEDACPEDFTAGACDYDQQAVVWYSFVATANATSVEFRNLAGAGTPFLGLFNNTGNCNLPTAVGGASCVTGDAGPFNITGGNTYLIAFGGDAEAAFSFEMRVNEQKVNDDPCAPGFAPTVVTAGNTIDDNTCATPDFTACGVTSAEGKTLFYRYTMTQNADLQINVAGSGGANQAGGPFYISAYEASIGCNDESNYINEDCTGELVIPCLSTGDVIIIMVATGENAGEFGEFALTITQNTPPRPANDECFNATEIEYENDDLCQWVDATAGETNVNACTESSDFGTGCDYDLEEVVWFTFTPPANIDPGSDLSIQFLDYSGAGQLFTTVFEDAATCDNLNPISACLLDLGPHGAIATVDPNTTYLIGVGSTGDAGGTFNIQINISSGPPNDDACEDLSAYDLTGGFLDDQSNLCSSPDGIFPECPAVDQTNTVFYTFTIAAPDYGIRLEVRTDNSNGTPVSFPIVGGISEPDGTFCPPPGNYLPPAICSDDGVFEFTCLEEGTYQFQLSTSEANSGDFRITAQLLQQDLSCDETADGDDCENAGSNVITGFLPCEPFNVRGCNTHACPEAFDHQGCGFDQFPVVWYSFTTPDGLGINMDITGFSATDNSGFLAIFNTTCPVPAFLSDCIPSDAGDVLGIGLAGNTTYHIAVGNSNGTGGDFGFDITINVPPTNDSPCMGSVLPPYDLGTNGSHAGTTCCADGENNNPDFEQGNVFCNTLTDDNAVWYRAEFAGGNYDGVEINITGGTIGNNVAVEVYVGGPDGACDGTAVPRDSKCDGLPVQQMKIGCIQDGEYIFIKVTSTENDCGTFNIDIKPIEDCDVADECEDIAAAQTLNPVTHDGLVYVCTTGCLDLSCPENPNPDNGCNFTQTPTVWYAVETDANAGQLFTTVTSNSGTWQPIWSVFHGDCDNLINAASGGAPGCSNGDNTPDLHQTGVISGVDLYYIAVTYDPADPPGDDTGFTVCAATIVNVIVCLGDINDNCDPDPSVSIKITSRENADAEPNVDPDIGYLGPFCPGEEVMANISFFYDASETGQDWLIGFVTTFGQGWDMAGYDYEANPATGTGGFGGPADWHELGGPCAPLAAERFSFLCTYTDEFGNLQICNSLCESCLDCDKPYIDPLDPLPSGWFWLSNGGAGCVNSSCQPHHRFGIGSVQSTVTWNFPLRVRTFETEEECQENDDLQISFQTFSDGGAGCWEDPIGECLIDRKQVGPLWKINCEIPVGVVSLPQPRNICTDSEAGVTVATEDGSTLDIEVWYEPNNEVTGMNTHLFSGGVGVINDILSLVNDDCVPIEVIYYARVIDPSVICEGLVDTILVTVFPKPEMEQDDIPGACFPSFEIYNLEDFITCRGYNESNPGIISISWTGPNGTSGNTPLIQFNESTPPGIHTYLVTLTDELGCSNEFEIRFEVYPPVEFTIPDLVLCYDDFVEQICPVFTLDGTAPYTYYWNLENPSCNSIISSDDCVDIDPQEILENCEDDPMITFNATLLILDSHFCENSATSTVIIHSEPMFTIIPANPAFCEGAETVEVCLEVAPNSPYLGDIIFYNMPIGPPRPAYFPDYCIILDTEGLHSVVINTEAGCEKIVDFYVGQNIIEPFDILGDPIICVGESTTLTIDGTYDSYSWSTSETTQSITVSPTSNTSYSANVIDANGCFTSNSITVQVVNTTLPALPDTIPFCDGFSAIINAGAGYDVYNWHFGSPTGPMVGTTDTIEVNTEGWYFIEVFKDGCPALDSVYAHADDNLSPFVFDDFELCWDQQTTLISSSGGAFIDYVWTRTDVLPQQVWQGPTLSSMNLGEGSYELWVSDGNCDGVIRFDVTRAAPVVVDIVPAVDTVFICFNDVTNLTATPGFASYEWNTGQFGPDLNGVDNGVYSVTVTDADGCKGATSIVVFEYPPVTPNLGPNRDICEGDLVTLTPGPGFTTYTWYLDGVLVPAWNNQASITVGNGGVYEVVVTNKIGCSNRSTVTVIKTAQLNPSITGNQAICQGMVLTLSANQDFFKYTWKNAAGTIIGSGKTVNVTIAGIYTLEVESPTGCKGFAQVTVVVNITPTADVDADVKTVCGAGTTNNGNTILDFTQYINSTDPGVWTANNPGSGVVFNGNWSVVNFSNVAPGTYTFTYTTTNAVPPCQNASDVLTVNVVLCNCDPWTINPIADVCTEGSANVDLSSFLRSTPPGLPMVGTWSVTSGPGGNPLNGAVFNPSAALPGTYTLTFTLTNQGNFCLPSATVTINVIRAPQIGVVADQPNVCFGTGADFVLETLITGEDAGGTWTEISDRPSTGNAFNAAAGTFDTDGQLIGIYKFMYTLTATSPCVNKSITVQININPIPNADAGPDGFACAGGTVQIGGTATSTGTDFSFEWTDPKNAVISTQRTFQVTTSGKYKLKVTNNTSGCTHIDSVNVVIYPAYSGIVSGKDLLFNNETDILRLSLIGITKADVGNYIWYKDGVLVPGANGDSLVVNEAGEYCVDIIPAGADASACVVRACKLIETELTKEVYIPNIFSPNDDGKNEIFTVEGGKNVDQITNISIYDRWGELVFLSGSFPLSRKYEFGWNGIFKGQKAMQGVYVYVVDVLYKDGTRETIGGDITLIR